MEMGRKRHARPLYRPESHPVPIAQETGWVPGPVWVGEGTLISKGIRSPDQPVANSYTDYAVPSDAYRITLFIIIASQTLTAEFMYRLDEGNGDR
jgi:hypothetical protein